MELLVLLMILAPCQDHSVLGAAKTQSPQLHAALPNGGQADDDCSPLCTCSCCAAVSLSIHMPAVEYVAPSAGAKKFPVCITPDYGADLSAVWQPPRVS